MISVLEGFRVRLAVVQDDMDATMDSRWEKVVVKFFGINNMKQLGCEHIDDRKVMIE